MTPHDRWRLGSLLTVLAVLLVSPIPGAEAGTVTRPDRESSYPAEIVNITHSPWTVAAGQDLEVAATLATNVPPPDQVALLFCRVEPTYTCALPVVMEPDDADGTWRGTIEWDTRFMKPETVHIGYNVTLRYDDGRRIAAPTGNFWLPDTFPEASDGVYFFVAYGPGTPPQESPGVPLLLPLLFVALTLAFLGRRRS